MKHYLYELWSVHPRAKKSYIGITKYPEARFSTHKNQFSDTHAGRAVRKYGSDSFRMTILDCTDGLKEILQLENETILDRGIENLWNLMAADEYTKKPKVSEALRKNLSDAQKASWAGPEKRQKASESAKVRWEDPEERKRLSDAQKARCANPNVRQKMSDAVKEYYKNPENRKKQSDAQKTRWENPEERKRQSDAQTAHYKNPENRKRQSEAIRKAPLSEKEIRRRLKDARTALKKRKKGTKAYQQQSKMVQHYWRQYCHFLHEKWCINDAKET